MPARVSNAAPGLFSSIGAAQRRTLVAAALGWMLDAFDVMLYALVLPQLIAGLHISKDKAGFPNTLTLLASGIGGLLFGFIADRLGRRRALMLSIVTYSICSFASGLSVSKFWLLAIFRFILGLGMGGEWNTGATLVAETWPTALRAKALSVVQSSWAIGYAAAALVAWAVQYNPRYAFFVGIAPALVTLWIQRRVPESEVWQQRRNAPNRAQAVGFREVLTGSYAKHTFALLLMNLFGMFAWWGLFTWVPSYLKLPVSEGGRGFNASQTTTMLVVLNLTGMLPGYASFGWVADRIGRRKSFIIYTLVASFMVAIYAMARSPWTLLLLGTPVAFFGTGFFSGSGIIGSEIFPTRVRARALGFTYNGARTLSSLAPFVIGYVGQRKGLSWAFYLCSLSFLLATIMATQLPETKGKELE
jgi:MFS family permease